MKVHNHDHSSEYRNLKKSRLGWAIVINLVIMFCEVAGGIYSNSLALLSDAGHMLTHVFALGMSYFAIALTAKPANGWKTFGYFRAEVLAAFVNGVFLIIVTGFIVYEAVNLIISPEIIKTREMVVVAIAGLFANLASIFLLGSATKGDLNIRSAFIHVVGDAVSSLVVLAGALIIYYTGNYIVDPILSIFISILILIWGARLIKESANILLESSPKDIDVSMIQVTLKEHVPEIINIHDVHVWVLTSSLYCATLHAVVDDIKIADSMDIRIRIEKILHDNFNVEHANIQFETCDDTCDHTEGVI